MINRSKIIILVSVVMVVIVSVSVILFVWHPFDDSSKSADTNQTKPIEDTKDVDIIKKQALQAASSNKITEAKELYEKARQIYLSDGDTDGVIEIDDQLYILDHITVPPINATPETPAVSAEEGDN